MSAVCVDSTAQSSGVFMSEAEPTRPRPHRISIVALLLAIASLLGGLAAVINALTP
jgi:hypothetical protein